MAVGADESAEISINLRKAHADRPFVAAQGDKKGLPSPSGTWTCVLG